MTQRCALGRCSAASVERMGECRRRRELPAGAHRRCHVVMQEVLVVNQSSSSQVLASSSSSTALLLVGVRVMGSQSSSLRRKIINCGTHLCTFVANRNPWLSLPHPVSPLPPSLRRPFVPLRRYQDERRILHGRNRLMTDG